MIGEGIRPCDFVLIIIEVVQYVVFRPLRYSDMLQTSRGMSTQ